VLYFDHLITFSDEVEYFWNRRTSLTSVLFLWNRYFALASRIPRFVQLFTTFSDQVSKTFL
ncbi:hypothetical protein BD410DRAFT_727026, partial [Rickenella mellea]